MRLETKPVIDRGANIGLVVTIQVGDQYFIYVYKCECWLQRHAGELSIRATAMQYMADMHRPHQLLQRTSLLVDGERQHCHMQAWMG